MAVNLQKRKLLSSLMFLILGITLLWLVYRDFNFKDLSKAIKHLKFGWIIVSIVFAMLSHYIRALRWGMLINALGQKPGTVNLFLSIIILYFTNLIIPRGGEVTRCAIISKYEKVPFVKLIGTVFVERMTDLFAFLLILIFVLLFQFRFFETVMSYPGFQMDLSSFHIKLMPLMLIAVLIIILVLAMIKLRIFNKIYAKLKQLKGEFLEGISVIIHLKTKVKYIVYTIMIFLLWLLMLYVVFFAYPPTNKLSFNAAVLTYVFGTLAYLLPIQAGIGTWHFIVINCLFFYGIDKESGMIFALIAHTFTNLIFLILGPVAMAFLPVVNRKPITTKKLITKSKKSINP
jgi:glycosyltransferase 2 family protein